MLVAGLVAVPPALAQPSGSAFVYWANMQSGTIGRGTIDGNPANVNQSFIRVGNGARAVVGVAVDRQHIYWAGDQGIGRANLDGSDANPSFITSPGFSARAVAVDDQHIYWVGVIALGRANLDGSDVNETFITAVNLPAGVAVNSQDIYWSNNSNSGDNTIGRANLDGSDVNQNFITAPPNTNVGELAVDYQYIYWTAFGVGAIGRAKLDGSDV